MALFPPVGSVVAAAKLAPSSQLECQKNDFQHEPDKEESLNDLYGPKSRSHSCSLSTENSQHSSRHRGFCPPGLQSKYVTSQTKILAAKPVARQKEGVDRAYPLKPIFHHRGVSVPVVNTGELGSSPYLEDAPNDRPSLMSKGKPPAARSLLAAVLSSCAAELVQAASHPHRRELACILRLEADGLNLEKEIQKKEALLREKLRRTKEDLRRIQREKELVKAEERRDREAERTCEQKAARHPEEKSLRVTVRPDDSVSVFSGAQSAEATIPRPGSTLHPQKLAMGKLKKDRLVASNSKIQDRVPMEHLASYLELALTHSPSSPALSDRACGDLPSAEVQAAGTAELEGLGQCSFCGRSFLCTKLEKHMSVCSKRQGSKRKVFDSSRARAVGTEFKQFQRSSQRPQNEPPRRNDQKKHRVLIQTLHQACKVQQVLSKGGKVSDLSPLPPMENPDSVTCPCAAFAPQAAERHVPKCRNMENRPPALAQRRQC
ncbi:LOW QUALITY PROTEIN: zinc finger C2HC domain-containing protein 1C [Aegotheles albertisi]